MAVFAQRFFLFLVQKPLLLEIEKIVLVI
jgi:hypothetical protein